MAKCCLGEQQPKVLPLGAKRWPTMTRWLTLLFGVFGQACFCMPLTIGVWQNAMRAILNQTATEANIMAQVCVVGQTVALPASFLYEHFGSQVTALAGGVVASVTFVLMALATGPEWKFYFAGGNMFLLYVIWFFNAVGSVTTYMASAMPNIKNFPFEHRGKVIGLLNAASCMGPALLSVIYNTLFTGGHISADEEALQDLPGYFNLLAIIYAIVTLCLILFAGELKNSEDAEETENEYLLGSQSRRIEQKPPSPYSEFPFRDRSCLELLRHWHANYWFSLIQFSCAACCQLTFQNNIGTYLRSFNMDQSYNVTFTTSSNIAAAIASFFAGQISDALVHRYKKAPSSMVFLLPYAFQTAMLTISIWLGYQYNVLLATTIAVGVAFGITWSQSATVLADLYGDKYLPSNWGLTMFCSGMLGFAFSFAFSAAYEEPIGDDQEIYCYGIQCFTWSFALLAAASLCAFIMILGLTQNMYANEQDRRLAKSGVLASTSSDTDEA